VSGQIVAAELVGANPGPAAHIALLGTVVVAALVIFGIVRWRNKRETAEAEFDSPSRDDHTLASRPSTDETPEPVRPDTHHKEDS